MAAKNPFLTALERYQQRAGAGGRLREERELYSKLEEDLGIIAAQKIASPSDVGQFEGMGNLAEGVNETARELKSLEQNRSQGASKALLSKLTTLSTQSEMGRRVNVAASSSGVYMQSLSKVKTPTAKLESDYTNNMSQIADLGDELKSMAGNLDNPDTMALYRQKVAQMTQFESAAALSKTTIRTQAQMGLDPKGTVTAAQHAVNRTGGMVGRFDIEAKARGGEFGSLGEESGRLADMFRTLQLSLENYNEAQEGSAEAQEAAGQRLKSITEEIGEQEGIVGALRGGAGGGAGGGKLNLAQDVLKILGSAIRAGTDTYQSLQISQPMELMQNQARFANIANRQYETVGSMMEGNQMSFLKTMQMDTFRKGITEEMFGRGQIVKQGERAGEVVSGIGAGLAGVAAGGAMMTLGAPTGVGVVAGGAVASQGLSSLAGVVKGSEDIRKGITAGQIAANMAARSEEFFEALQGIPARQLQTFETQTRGAYAATTGLGAARSNKAMKGLLDLSKGGFVDQATQANISPTELLELTSLAGQTVGGADFERKSIISAGQAEQRGQLSKTQYMSMLGQLTDVGGRDQNMQEILSKAVTVGMDDSKSIGRMVSATVSLSEGGAAQGFNVSQAMSDLLMRGVGGISGTDLNMGQKTKMAASAAENLDRMYKMGGTDIFGLQEYSRLAKTLPEASYEQVVALEEAGNSSVQMFRTLLKGDSGSKAYDQAMGSLERSGFSSLIKDAKTGELDQDRLRKILGVKSEIVAARAMGIAPSMGAKKASAIADFVATGDQTALQGLTPQEVDVARVQFRRAGLGELFGAAAMMGGADPSSSDATIGEFRSGVMRKVQSKAIFDYNEMSAGNKRLEELFGVKDAMKPIPADISGLSFEEQEMIRGTAFGEGIKRETRQKETFRLQGDILHQAAKKPELALDDEKRQREIAANKAPDALTFEKQSKDFKDGVVVFEEGVKRFNEVVKTMEKGAVDRDSTGSEQTNTSHQQYLRNRHGITN